MMVGEPVSALHADSWNNDLLYLLAGMSSPIVNQLFPYPAVERTGGTFHVSFKLSGVTRALLVEWEWNQASQVTQSTAVDITIDGGAVTWIGTEPAVDSEFMVRATRGTSRAFIDVSALSANAFHDIIFDWNKDGDGSFGISRVAIVPVPLASTDPVVGSNDGETGLSTSWYEMGNPIDEGSATSQGGWVRLISLLDIARARAHWRHLQWCLQSPEREIVTSTTLVAVVLGMGAAPTFRTITRRLYTTATANTYNVRIYHNTTNTKVLTLRVIVTPVGGAATNNDFTFTGTGAETWATSGSTLSLPTSGTGQEVDITFEAKVDAATTANIYSILLCEAET
jgi:hypothetical protein